MGRVSQPVLDLLPAQACPVGACNMSEADRLMGNLN